MRRRPHVWRLWSYAAPTRHHCLPATKICSTVVCSRRRHRRSLWWNFLRVDKEWTNMPQIMYAKTQGETDTHAYLGLRPCLFVRVTYLNMDPTTLTVATWKSSSPAAKSIKPATNLLHLSLLCWLTGLPSSLINWCVPPPSGALLLYTTKLCSSNVANSLHPNSYR